MNRKDYRPMLIYAHDYREVIKSAAKLRGISTSEFVRLTAGESAKREVSLKVLRISNASGR